MGRDGSEEISCSELAEKAETITWEIVTRIGPRVRRVFVWNNPHRATSSSASPWPGEDWGEGRKQK